jgi:hypothetical protein
LIVATLKKGPQLAKKGDFEIGIITTIVVVAFANQLTSVGPMTARVAPSPTGSVRAWAAMSVSVAVRKSPDAVEKLLRK